MNLPEGLKLYEGRDKKNTEECVILKKCIYGTVQAARQWAKTFKNTLKSLHFKISCLGP